MSCTLLGAATIYKVRSCLRKCWREGIKGRQNIFPQMKLADILADICYRQGDEKMTAGTTQNQKENGAVRKD